MVETVKRNGGYAVLATHQVASAPNPVTGRSSADAVEPPRNEGSRAELEDSVREVALPSAVLLPLLELR